MILLQGVDTAGLFQYICDKLMLVRPKTEAFRFGLCRLRHINHISGNRCLVPLLSLVAMLAVVSLSETDLATANSTFGQGRLLTNPEEQGTSEVTAHRGIS